VALWEDPSEACSDQPCAVDTVTRTIEAERARGALIVQLGFGADPHSNQGAGIDLLTADADPIGALLLERSVVDVLAERRPSRDDLRLHHAVVGTAGSTRVVRGMLSGLLVVFLLFTAAGASGWLIEEEQQATLSLLLTTQAGLGRILGSQWLFLLSLGSLQATLMVLWATLVFGLAWTGPLQILRVIVVAVATAATTAAFGLLLAALVRTRAQLGATSMIAILLLSALGGSFVPRVAMPQAMQTVGLMAPTTWAVGGLWRALDPETSLTAVVPASAVLAGFAALFLAMAARLTRRRIVA